ncbi:MAG: hypothetical protein C0520_10580 [Sphingopyxis sp.]|nr:hypothetical protein [Sphingopyxis sp.]
MPGLPVRADGWTAARTRVFLATLGQTGCITDAARIAGVSRTSVNRSRALFAPFDKACGEAVARALRGLEAVAYERAVEGREMVILRVGKGVERRIVPSDSLLGLLIKRGDLKGGQNVHPTPEEAEAYVLPRRRGTASCRARNISAARSSKDGRPSASDSAPRRRRPTRC